MKKSIILLLVLLPIVAFSQMQHIISQGNTSTTKRQIHTNLLIDSSLIKIRNVDAENLIYSIPVDTNFSTILNHTTLGTNTISQTTLNGLKIYDFKTLEDYIYFCGSYNNTFGFIAWTKINDLFSSFPSPITIQLINNPIVTRFVSELEVYKLDGDIHIAALASNQYLIHLNTATPATYQIMGSQYDFRGLSVGYKKISTIENINDSIMIVSVFDANGIQNCMYRMFSHPTIVYDEYLLENSKDNANVFTLAYTHLKTTSNNVTYKTDFITYDENINIINQQYLEDEHSKLDPVDLEYCIEDNKLLYLTTGRMGGDAIYTIEPFATQTYVSRAIQPTYQSIPPTKLHHSITRYDDYYFATAGVDTTLNSLLLFDCKRNASTPTNCSTTYNVNVYNCNHFTIISNVIAYNPYLGMQNTTIIKPKYQKSKYVLICN